MGVLLVLVVEGLVVTGLSTLLNKSVTGAKIQLNPKPSLDFLKLD